MMHEKFSRTKVPQGSNGNGRSARNSRYRWLRRIERLRARLPFRNGWRSVADGYVFWSVSQVMECFWWLPSFVSVGYAPFASGGDH